MLILKIVLVVLVNCCLIRGHLVIDSNGFEKASNFVRDVITKLNSEDSSTRDVILFRLGLYKSSKRTVDDIYESLIDAVPKENIVVTPRLDEVSDIKNIRKTAVIIIVSDVYDFVS